MQSSKKFLSIWILLFHILFTSAFAEETTIHAGYQLQMNHPDDPKLNKTIRVDIDGNAVFPYVGKLNVQKMSLKDLHSKLSKSYAQYYKSKTQFELTVTQQKIWVEVFGLVKKPGKVLIDPTASLEEVLSEVGGLASNTSEIATIKIQNENGTQNYDWQKYLKTGEGIPEMNWQGGEKIFYAQSGEKTPGKKASNTVTFIGEINKPNEVQFEKSLDFYDYLRLANGPTANADFTKIELLREDSDGTKHRVLDQSELWNLTIQPGDRFLIHAKKTEMFEKLFQAAANVAAVVSAAVLVILVL